MPNPKKLYEKPECDLNDYRDTARASATVPTGWIWGFVGPAAAAPQMPPPPPAAPLAGAALAALQTQAAANAQAKATDEMRTIGGYSCPGKCKKKTPAKEGLQNGGCVGAPKLSGTLINQHFTIPTPAGPLAMVLTLYQQVWVQEAEQNYAVEFVCE